MNEACSGIILVNSFKYKVNVLINLGKTHDNIYYGVVRFSRLTLWWCANSCLSFLSYIISQLKQSKEIKCPCILKMSTLLNNVIFYLSFVRFTLYLNLPQ